MFHALNVTRSHRLLGLVFGLAIVSECTGATLVLPAGGSGLTGGSANFGGTVFGDVTSAFSGPGGLFSGTLRTLAVQEAGGTFDFYYQIRNTTTNPAEFIDGFTARDFTGFNTEVDWITNGLTGIAGAGAFSIGSTVSESASRDLSPADDIAFFFPLGSQNNLVSQNPSRFFLIKTNARNFGSGSVQVSGAGVTAPIASFAPASAVPEPGTAIFGAGLMGWIGSVRHRRANRAASQH